MTDVLPRAYGPTLGRARMRVLSEDFFVDENLGFQLTGQGEHLFIHVRKRERTTDQVAGALARVAGVPRRAVGYAGMKDKWALTQQWFSVHLPGRELELLPGKLDDGIEVLAVSRHDRKLRRGALRGNRFRLRLRDVQASVDATSRRLGRIARYGVPNYFGEQRFGRDGDNVSQARALLAGELKPRNRALRGILLSAARSHLFNQVLAERLHQGNWATALDGDLMVLDGRRSLFMASEEDPTLHQRVAALEVHPSGPLCGRGGMQPEGRALALEQKVLSAEQELVDGLAGAGLDGARRALRLRVADLAWHFPEKGTVELSFFLPAGAYATCVVRELFEC